MTTENDSPASARYTDEQVHQKLLLARDKTLDWWLECIEARRGKGIATASGEFGTAQKYLEVYEQRTGNAVGNRIDIGYAKYVPEDEEPEECSA